MAIINNKILIVAHKERRLLVDFGKKSKFNPIKIEATNGKKGMIQIN
jgi:hypothetical protein